MVTQDRAPLRSGELHHFDYQGVRVAYRRTGAGRPMLFLHNGGSSSLIWDHQLHRFSASHECVAFDLPGFGRSASADQRYTLRFYFDFLTAFIEGQNLPRVSLVGNCMGSAISLTYGLENAERVESMVLFNVLTKNTIWGGEYGRVFKWTEPFAGVRKALRSAASGLVTPRILRRRFVSSQFGNPAMRDTQVLTELADLYRQKGQLAALADVLVDIDAYGALDEREIPRPFPRTLVIWGDRNRVLPFGAGQRLVGTLKPHEFEVMRGGGHLAMREQSDQANLLIEKFLAVGGATSAVSTTAP